MRFKKTRQEVINEIRGRVSCQAYNQLNSIQYNMKFDSNSIINALNMALSEAITEGFRVLLENEYTDEDFERDMNLK